MKNNTLYLIFISLTLSFLTNNVNAQQKCKGDCTNGYGTLTGIYANVNFSKYIGNFKEEKFHDDDGELIIKNEDYTSIFFGKFVDDIFIEGTHTINWKTKSKKGIWIKEEINSGFFENEKLKNGLRKLILSDGSIKKFEIDNFIEVSSSSSKLNKYSEDEISGPVNQLLELNQVETKLYLELDFTKDVVKSKCVFDTGAHGLSLNKKTYSELRNLKLVERLDVDKTKSYGVGGSTDVFYIVVKSVIIGDFKVDNVIATADMSDNDRPNLVGINFFDKFKNVIWNKNDNTLELFK